MSPGAIHDHDAPRAGDVELLNFADPVVQKQINALMDACHAADGHVPFGDHELLAIAAAATRGHVGFGVIDGTTLVGYAHLSQLGDAWFTEVAVRPDRRGAGIAARLMDAVLAHVAADGGGTLSTWAYKMDGPSAGLARHVGFRPERTLFQLRLPTLPSTAPALPDGYMLDRFRVGEHEAEWLDLNRRAFAHLPDQGAWTEQDLSMRLSAPWFRAEDFLLLRDPAGRLAGACWCKIDPLARTHDGEQIGEIYVVAVAPEHEGHGLGKTVVVHGLAHMRERGAQVGMLYVDGRNTRALLLYDSLGFHTHHEDVCLTIDVF